MPTAAASPRPPPRPIARAVGRMPPASFFLTSAVFHYLGPSLAVLLFAHIQVLGVAWLRIVSAAAVFALWRRPWRILAAASRSQRLVFLALGVVLAAMNSMFYLAVDRLPLSTVGAIEFLGTVVLAAAGARTRRNVLALGLAVGGVLVLTALRLSSQPLGLAFAFANCIGFMLYVILGHRIATTAADGSGPAASPMSGIDQLGLSMLVAAAVATPFGIVPAALAFAHPAWLAWGIGVGVCSSVIPYVTDQLAMARLPRATFALMLALLPAAATVIGLIVLHQVPALRDIAGVSLVILGIAIHHDRPRVTMLPARLDTMKPTVSGERRTPPGRTARARRSPPRASNRAKGTGDAVREPRWLRAEGVADWPGDDELRRPCRAAVGPE
jgi:inner membrane transporter RhtA